MRHLGLLDGRLGIEDVDEEIPLLDPNHDSHAHDSPRSCESAAFRTEARSRDVVSDVKEAEELLRLGGWSFECTAPHSAQCYRVRGTTHVAMRGNVEKLPQSWLPQLAKPRPLCTVGCKKFEPLSSIGPTKTIKYGLVS